MKRILGLDLGTNSIGWALIEQDFQNKYGKILGVGSRIIPMSQDVLGEFGKGNSVSQTAERTGYRSIRRLRERYLLRRERLHRVLNMLGFLPEHYARQIDFEKRLGKFFEGSDPKLAYNGKEFIFKFSFEEMLADFRDHQPQLLVNKHGEAALIPYDWTIYYLRKKALINRITKEELAWVILNFNQKRGYYQLRGEEEDSVSNNKEFVARLKVVQIEKGEKDKKNENKNWYNIVLENGWVYSAPFSSEPLWLNTEREFLVVEEYDADGNIKIVKDKRTDKEGKEKRKITPLPSFEEIELMSKKEQDKIFKKIKARTEITISNSGKTVGAYIYDTLLQNPGQKIKGKLVRTIERKFYKDELKRILEKQIELQPELFTYDLYNDCVRELYRSNEAQQLSLGKRDFVHLFLEDIIFYQRPLRSQKSSISNCSLECRAYRLNGEEKTEHLKAIPKSNPYYQEFRVWQWLYNLRFYKKDDDTDVTNEFIKSVEDLENLFGFLMIQKEVDHKDILKYFFIDLKGNAQKAEIAKYRWNYVFNSDKDESKKYPMNETGYEIRRRLARVETVPPDFLTGDVEKRLWHIIYSVTDKKEYESALKSFAEKHHLNIESFAENFKKFPPFKSEYGTFSEKAIKKLLLLLRIGKYWSWEAIDNKTKSRIGKIITGEFDEEIKNKVREKAERHQLKTEADFQGLPLWLAQYIVYGRHSKASITGKWNAVKDLEAYLEAFRQHSLRNPIVEQVVIETLRVVRDIWQHYGNGNKNYFDEIHIELGREMKNTAEERKRLTNIVSENENTNLRIKALLIELLNDGAVEHVRPFSPMQQEILKIYEDDVLNSGVEVPEDIGKISRKAEPTRSELQRYKLWLEQKYRSPYTGEVIPLNKLFTPEYEIEHIIPQSRFFDDSFSNKVICETTVNKLKDNQIGLTFIKNHHGEKVPTGFGREVQIFTEEQYKAFVKEHYAKSRSKRNKLLLEDIPEKMIERQINDTRYISKFISNVLSNIVRSDQNDDGVNSKNLIPGNGKITATLKQDWGLNDVWNDLILSRFERMNKITGSNLFTAYNEKYQKNLPTVPLGHSKGFQKKRIDHRHHALDALVIACATRDHVNLLNNKHAKSKERFDLNRKLRKFENVVYIHTKTGERIEKEVPKDFIKPWEIFTIDAKKELEKIVVSFKQNLRVINKATNKYEKWVENNGKKRKELVEQKGVNWAIRKSLHSPMPYSRKEYEFNVLKIADCVGKKELIIDQYIRNEVERVFNQNNGKISEAQKALKENSIFDKKGEAIVVTPFKIKTEKFRRRQPITILANRGQGGIKTVDDATKIINKVADFNIRKDLLEYLKECNYDIDKAFSSEGLENFNSKRKIPIYRLPIAESGTGRFAVGHTIGTKHKWVESDKGTNLFFAIYQDGNGKRNYVTIPLNEVVERQKQGLSSVPEINERGDRLLFHLSPNDLVYVPSEEESTSTISFNILTKEQADRIYRMVSSTGSECYFVHSSIASLIKNYDAKSKIGELGSLNKLETTLDGILRIKEKCVKLKVDRLGSVSISRPAFPSI